MSAPEMGQQGENGVQKAPKSEGRVALAGGRDQADSGNERGTTSFISYSDCP